MPMYELKAPNGKTYRIEGPPGATEAQVRAEILRRDPAAGKAQSGIDKALNYAAGAMANFNRGTGIFDEAAAYIDARITQGKDYLAGKGSLTKSTGSDWLERDTKAYNEAAMARQRAREDGFASTNPNVAALARGTGMAPTVLIPGGPSLKAAAAAPRAVNVAKGVVTAATQAGALGLVDRGALGQRVEAAKRAASDPLTVGLGALGGAIAPALPKTPGASRMVSPEVAALQEAGVFLTPGQAIPGLKTAEDVAMRAPFLGAAIKDARNRGIKSLNRVVANRALEPIGETLPESVKTGHQSVKHVAEKLGDTFDAAADVTPVVALDDEFSNAVSRVQNALDEFPLDVRRQFETIFKNRVTSRIGSGALSGKQLRAMQSEIDGIAADRLASDDSAQRALGAALNEISDEMLAVLGRANPEALDMINNAREGWANYVRLRSAAAKAKGGIAAPGQFATAVRVSDKSVGKGNVAKGEALLQDIIDPAWQVMPDQFGNPGTTDAASAIGLVGSIPFAPQVAIPAITGLGTAALPYLAMGRKAGRPLAQIAKGAKSPEQLLSAQELARLLSRAGGVAGASASSRP